MRFEDLPDDMILYCRAFLRPEWLVWLNRSLYKQHHHLVSQRLWHRGNKWTFLQRWVLQHDWWFVFQRYVEEECATKWTIMEYRVLCETRHYSNMVYCMVDCCMRYHATGCERVLLAFLDAHGMCRNLPKKRLWRQLQVQQDVHPGALDLSPGEGDDGATTDPFFDHL